MLTWSRLLDAYEASVRVLEEAVAAGEVPELPRWQVPDRRPPAPPARADWDRFVGLQRREARCQAAIHEFLDEISEELADARRTAAAAHAYAHPGQAPLRR